MMTLESFGETAEAVNKVTQETKLLYSEYYSGQTGNKVYFRSKNIQYTEACKVRGAYYKISTLTNKEKARGLITVSADNHTQDMAYATKLAETEVTIVVPTTTSLIKVNRIKGYDAEVVPAGDVFDKTCARAYELADKFGYTFVRPFDDLAVATGQGVITMKIIEELPTVDYTLVPVGGGGFCTGVSTLAKLPNPKVKVTDMEPAGANCMRESLKADHMVGPPDVNTIVDGTAVKYPGEKIFPYTQENADDIITIEDSELIVAFLNMAENHKMIVEDSGLLTVATLKHMNVEKRKIVSVLSGGNMDMITMASIIQHGLIQKNGVLTVSVFLPNKPGGLARVSTFFAKRQGNVIKLGHNQFISTSRSMAVELRITIKAYGAGHKNAVVQVLNNARYRPKLVKSKGTYTEQDGAIQKTAVVTSKNT